MFTDPRAGRGMACFKCHKEANCLELKKHRADEGRQQVLSLRMRIRVLVKESK